MPAKKSAKSPPENAALPPTYDQVAQRAFEIYEARGGTHGLHEDDWQAAEAELGQAAEPAAVTQERDHHSANGDPSGTGSMDA